MTIRKALAKWTGYLKSGMGSLELESGAYVGAYSFSSRFEQGLGTNPEELIAAAHAACFSMAFCNGLTQAGFTPTSIHTTASVTFDKGADGFSITQIDLETEAEVPGIDEDTFQTEAAAAKKGCPVSKALAAVPKINLKAQLHRHI